MDRNIIEDNLSTGSIRNVAHYTKIGNLANFMPKLNIGWSSAWATPIQFLNDRLELVLGLNTIMRALRARTPEQNIDKRVLLILTSLLEDAGRTETDAFQMSFSGNVDDLGQWRGYGSNGFGCSVVTSSVAVWEVSDVAGWVIYDKSAQEIFANNLLDNLFRKLGDKIIDFEIPNIEKILISAAGFMKHEGFRSEEEFRLIKFASPEDVHFRESGDRIVPYIDFLKNKSPLPINKIYVGPGWQLHDKPKLEFNRNHIVQAISRILYARGLQNVPIEPSSIPYDPK